jgi:hypothetical protein
VKEKASKKRLQESNRNRKIRLIDSDAMQDEMQRRLF